MSVFESPHPQLGSVAPAASPIKARPGFAGDETHCSAPSNSASGPTTSIRSNHDDGTFVARQPSTNAEIAPLPLSFRSPVAPTYTKYTRARSLPNGATNEPKPGARHRWIPSSGAATPVARAPAMRRLSGSRRTVKLPHSRILETRPSAPTTTRAVTERV